MDLPSVTAPDADARRAAVARHDELAVPTGGLGLLAELGCWLAACQGTCPPRPPARPRVVVVAADHGIAEAGVSAYPPEVTARQLAAAREQSLPASVLAPVSGASVRVVDVAVDDGDDGDAVPDVATTAGRYRVRRSSGRIDRADALTEEETTAALSIGRTLADEEVDAGADLLVPASLGVGATTPASVLVAALTGIEPVAVVGRGSGIDDVTWMRKAVAIRDGLRRARPHARDPLALLRVAGGADLAVLTGFLAQAALRRTPALLDGLVVGAAALVAEELAPGARDWWLAAQRSPEPAMALVLDQLQLTPLVDLNVRLGDGTGALAVVPLLQMSARLLAETATEAGSGIAPSRAAS
ncbi:nicotinate-nucleotide--dimethylbenzimidazole phosphoribosyltransferase [Pseudonocardia sp. H11422]|uniref:nicotinate-nucleotide--dimethylbenzimidazole phosphoribosyltransferase n=1 Tax=Pseudonocardia sp. H11422 TaxID=2835866 RepID=UPI001BDD1386|nr:nicotinate-nucleotide--dimethylbenzimidazole phosphoribosyltransferase [Pseudonocardia sp. H11422]